MLPKTNFIPKSILWMGQVPVHNFLKMNFIPAAQFWFYHFYFHFQDKCGSVILPGSPGSSPRITELWHQQNLNISQHSRQEQNDICGFYKLLLPPLSFKKMNKDELYYIFPPDNFSKLKKFWFMILFWTPAFRASYSLTFITYWSNTKFSIKVPFTPLLPCIEPRDGCVSCTRSDVWHHRSPAKCSKVSHAIHGDFLNTAQLASSLSPWNKMLKKNTCRHWAPYAQQPYILVAEIKVTKPTSSGCLPPNILLFLKLRLWSIAYHKALHRC